MGNVTVIDHPLVQHKLSLMRRKETDTARFRLLLREISLLLGYEVTRDFALETRAIETPLAPMQAPFLAGKKLVLISILRARKRAAGRHAGPDPLGARRPCRSLPGSGDAAGGGILFQGARGSERPSGHRSRPDAGDREFGDRRGRKNSRKRTRAGSSSCACSRRPKASRLSARRTRTCRSTPPRSTSGLTITAISSRASATPGTGCTAPSKPARPAFRRCPRSRRRCAG